MRICAADWCYLGRSGLAPEAYYRRLASLGITGVEMVATADRPAARAAGLTLVTDMMGNLNVGFNDVRQHDALLQELAVRLRQAQADGITQFIVFSGQRAGRSEADGIAACIQGLRRAATLAQQAGVTLILEVLNEHDHPDYQCSHLRYALAVVQAVASPAVRILYDLYHGAKMHDDPAQLPAAVPWIAHLHVAAVPDRTCPTPSTLPDYRQLVTQLTAAGYRGWWGLEYLPGKDVFGELHQAQGLLRAGLSGVRAATGA